MSSCKIALFFPMSESAIGAYKSSLVCNPKLFNEGHVVYNVPTTVLVTWDAEG